MREKNPRSEQDPCSEPWRENWFVVTCVGVVSLALYAATLYPDLSGGDSGELTAAAYTLGVGHPPGYPLYSVFGKLFTLLLPVSTVAWRINLGTAAFGAAASAFLYAAASRYSRSIGCGILATGLYSFCPLVWSFHIQGEVFAFNNFFVVLLVWVSLRYFDSIDVRWARVGAFIMGFGLANQHTLIVFEGPLMICVVAAGGRQILGKELVTLAALFFLGFSLYVYMPLSTANSSYVCWGDCHHWEGFWRHLLRVEYGSTRLYADESEKGKLTENLRFWTKDVVWRQTPLHTWIFFPIGFIVSLLRAARGRSHGHGMEWAIAFTFLFYMIGFHALANFPLEGHPENVEILMRFWMQPDTLFMLYLAEGLKVTVEYLGHKLSQPHHKFHLGTCLLLVLVQIVLWFDWINQSGNFAVPEFGKDLLDPLPANALFLTMGDIATNSIRYVQTCENYRTDVYLIDQNILSSEWFTELHAQNFPGVVFPDRKYWPGSLDGFDSREFFDNNIGKYRIFIFPGVKDESYLDANYMLVPYGYAQEVVRRPHDTHAEPWDFNAEKWLVDAHRHLPPISNAMAMPESKYPTGSWEYKPKDFFWNCMQRYGTFTMEMLNNHRELTIELALRIFQQGSDVAPHEGNYISFHRQLGTACYYAHESGIREPSEMVQCIRTYWGQWIDMVRKGAMSVHGPDADRASRQEADHLERVMTQLPALEQD